MKASKHPCECFHLGADVGLGTEAMARAAGALEGGGREDGLLLPHCFQSGSLFLEAMNPARGISASWVSSWSVQGQPSPALCPSWTQWASAWALWNPAASTGTMTISLIGYYPVLAFAAVGKTLFRLAAFHSRVSGFESQLPSSSHFPSKVHPGGAGDGSATHHEWSFRSQAPGE